VLLEASDCQLVLVDHQERLMPAIHEGAEVLQRALVLTRIAHLLNVPILGTEQTPDKLGALDPAVRTLCRRVLSKSAFSAVDEGLADMLRPPSTAPAGNARSLPKHLQKKSEPMDTRQTVLLAGVEAHVCLLQTALGLVEQEWDVWVVTDASGSRKARDRDAAYDRLAGNGVELVTVEMVAFEWLGSADHPHFKTALSWIK
jgi:nicotinamidase-related amidase